MHQYLSLQEAMKSGSSGEGGCVPIAWGSMANIVLGVLGFAAQASVSSHLGGLPIRGLVG